MQGLESASVPAEPEKNQSSRQSQPPRFTPLGTRGADASVACFSLPPPLVRRLPTSFAPKRPLSSTFSHVFPHFLLLVPTFSYFILRFPRTSSNCLLLVPTSKLSRFSLPSLPSPTVSDLSEKVGEGSNTLGDDTVMRQQYAWQRRSNMLGNDTVICLVTTQ